LAFDPKAFRIVAKVGATIDRFATGADVQHVIEHGAPGGSPLRAGPREVAAWVRAL